MPADWDADSPELRRNLDVLLASIRRSARARRPPSIETARIWHHAMLENLEAENPRYRGAFRGEVGLEDVQVTIGGVFAVAAPDVAVALGEFENRLQLAVASLDENIPLDALPNANQLEAIVVVCAWAHAEWVRIHPFANGNGRTARLWANSLAMRY